MFAEAYKGKKVWLSGVTGFKGAWLAQWLTDLGAEVTGYATEPPTAPALFDLLELRARIRWQSTDIRDAKAVRDSIAACAPDYVFHLAAQPLVRESYEVPVETWEINVMGTIHVMEALRGLTHPCAAVIITTDKCYENQEWVHSYREVDPLGGYDPYSSSKAGAEVAIAAWRRSFFGDHPVRMASARSGNVVGGGDFARDRIIPDCIRSLQARKAITVRNRLATRPWQHVLEPLGGYLWLGALLSGAATYPTASAGQLTGAFNFGPGHEANRKVEEVVEAVLQSWPGQWQSDPGVSPVHEATLLNLAIDKAYHFLGWQPLLGFEAAIAKTIEWYRAWDVNPAAMSEFTLGQIRDFQNLSCDRGLPWGSRTKTAPSHD